MNPSEVLANLDPIPPADLLDHLAASRRERAETIRRYWETPEARGLAENLIELEVDDEARSVVVTLLRERDAVDL